MEPKSKYSYFLRLAIISFVFSINTQTVIDAKGDLLNNEIDTISDSSGRIVISAVFPSVNPQIYASYPECNVYIDKETNIIYSKEVVHREYFKNKAIKFKRIPPKEVIREITLSFVGDIRAWGLTNDDVPYVSYSDFKSFYTPIRKYIQLSDIAFCNLELPIAKGLGYSFNIPYNGPPSLLKALRWTGFDVFNTANNHCLDRGWQGIDLTIDALDRFGLAFLGTGKVNSQDIDLRFIERKGISIAFMAYADILNRNPKHLLGRKVSLIDFNHTVVSRAKKNYYSTASLNDVQRICRKIEKLKKEGIDLVVVYLHIHAYHICHAPVFREVAKLLCLSGADIIVVSGWHELEPFEKIVDKGGTGAQSSLLNQEREHLVAYGLGNFERLKESDKPSLILYVKIVKTSKGTFLKTMEYLPVYAHHFNKTVDTSGGKATVNYFRVYAIEELINLLKQGKKVEGIKEDMMGEESLRLKKMHDEMISRFGRVNLMRIR